MKLSRFKENDWKYFPDTERIGGKRQPLIADFVTIDWRDEAEWSGLIIVENRGLLLLMLRTNDDASSEQSVDMPPLLA